jgi:hypothetical protein
MTPATFHTDVHESVLHVAVLGIDGSGKSSVAAALPALLAGELKVRAGSAGEEFSVVDPDQDHLGRNFAPDGLPWLARMARRFKRMAKRFVNHRRLYPIFKVAHMLAQDAAARRLARRHGVQVMVSDGNALLSGMGRAANYLRPASKGGFENPARPGPADRQAALAYVLEGQPLPEESRRMLPFLGVARAIQKALCTLGIEGMWLPDVVIFLDLPAARAMERICGRGRPIDIHENEADLTQAREAYLETLEAVSAYRPESMVVRIAVDGLPAGKTLERILEVLRPHLAARHDSEKEDGKEERPLGTSNETSRGSIWVTVLSPRYVLRYLLPNWFRGSWREITFPLSRFGRALLRHGYSAEVMRHIYEQDLRQDSLLDRAFLGYPLHRAVHDRLGFLISQIEPEIERRLRTGQKVSILTAPSGFSYDLFRALEDIADRERPSLVKRVEIVAADLDPEGAIAPALGTWAARLGVSLTFIPGDLTKAESRAVLERIGPFDMTLFVGLSGWLPKPCILAHLKWVRKHLHPDGVLITDCFTADAYALSGRYVGFKASYYHPAVYRALLDYCGFDGPRAVIRTGRDGINHVLVAPVQVLSTSGPS